VSAGGAQSPDPPDPPDPSDRTAIQDRMVDNFCWGCGADNPDGLHLKSYRDGDIVVAEWWPSPAHAAGPRHFVNGGIIATLLDCHGVSTAIADAYRREHRELGSDPEIWCATAAMTVEYLRPTPIDAPVSLTARVVEVDGRDTTVECTLASGSKLRARASVRSVRVPGEWRHGARPAGM
jgi:acyl-coenzyme A thioesterase PaaI-like protein